MPLPLSAPKSEGSVSEHGRSITVPDIHGTERVLKALIGPATEASTDMTPRVIAAVGLNRRASDFRHPPNGCLLGPDAP